MQTKKRKTAPRGGTKKKSSSARVGAKAASVKKASHKPSIFIYGAGKVGSALARELSARGYAVALRPARKGLPKKRIEEDVIILSVRDRDLVALAEEIAAAGIAREDAVVLHNAGALGAEALDPLRAFTAGVGQLHPMISFASKKKSPSLASGNAHVQGDAAASRIARELALALGMSARTIPNLDSIGYHAAAGLVANGAAALAAVGASLLERAGVPAAVAPKMLAPLLRSVAENVDALGFPEALTGPVRRGDSAAIHKQINLLKEKLPAALPLFIASITAQLPLARKIGEAPPPAFDAIAEGVRQELASLLN
jgi:predicted short-subunit dehydrogenase-like oxidoreductase (DUF2520 family)